VIRATISEVKNSLSAYLRRVRAGETVMIMDRTTPVASLIPAGALESVESRLEKLIAAGLLDPPSSSEAFQPIPVAVDADIDAIDALVEERRIGR